MTIAKDVLEKIKESRLRPKPKWQFSLKEILIWTFFAINILVGALASSVIIFLLKYNDFDLVNRFKSVEILKMIPYFWLILLLLFLLVGYLNFKQTKEGYKYRFMVIFLGGIMASLVLGFIFYSFGWADKLEDRFQKHLPFYKDVVAQRMSEANFQIWSRPEMGMLGGQVFQIESPLEFYIQDFKGEKWLVIVNQDELIFRPRADFKSFPELEEGMWLKIMGQDLGEYRFEAIQIRPAFKPQMMEMKEIKPEDRILR